MRQLLLSLFFLLLLFQQKNAQAQSITGSTTVCPLEEVRYTLNGVSCTNVSWNFSGPGALQVVAGGSGQSYVVYRFPDEITNFSYSISATYSCAPGNVGTTYLENVKIKQMDPMQPVTVNAPIECVRSGAYTFQAENNATINYNSLQWSTNTGWPLVSTGVTPPDPNGVRIMQGTYNINNVNPGYVKVTYKSKKCPTAPAGETIWNITRPQTTSLPAPTWSAGTSHFCVGESVTFAVQPYANVVKYVWNSDQPSMRFNGQAPPVETTTPSVSVSEATNTYKANITVVAQTLCGNSAPNYSQTVVGLQGYEIAGEDFACRGDVGFYWVSPMGNVPGITYNWIAGGATILSGQGSYKIRVRWGQGTGVTSVSCFMTKAGCSSANVSKEVELCNIVEFAVTPNPAKGNVVVSLAEENNRTAKVVPAQIDEVRIADKSGRNVYQQVFGAGNLKRTNIDISKLKPDVYIIQVRSGKIWSSKQIIVQH